MQRKETQLAASHGHSLLELLLISVFKKIFHSRVKHGDCSAYREMDKVIKVKQQ